MRREVPRGLESSGKVSEYFLFGKVKTGDPAYEREARTCLAIKDPETKKVCAISLIRKYQPFDPKNPKKIVLKDLLLGTAEFLGLKSQEDKDRLEVLTAVDSIADFVCHADVIVLLKERDWDNFRILKIDYSEHPKTLEDPESSEADLVIGCIRERGEIKNKNTGRSVTIGFSMVPIA